MKDFSRFVKEVFPDPSSEEALQALCASAIFPSIESRRAIYLYGDGPTGKSVFRAAIEQIVPSIPVLIHELATTKLLRVQVFATPLVFVIDEDSVLSKRKRRLACQNILNILTQSTIRGVYAKFYNPVRFRPSCRLLFISNAAPTWPEGFEEFHEWTLPVEMPRRFGPREADPDLKGFYRKSRLGTFDWICAIARKRMGTEG